MDFWIESSLAKLYDNTVEAFPNTQYRQNSTNPIIISKLQWVPFLGLKTLFIKGSARNESRQYEPIILFKGVDYKQTKENARIIELAANDGNTYFLSPLSFDNTDVAVRCSCKDFFWRFHHYNHEDKSLFGRNRKKYEGHGAPANPQELAGVCKHLLKLGKVLKESGIIR